MNVGFIGLGVMGSRMLRHLVGGGHRLTVYDVDTTTREKVAAATGATPAASPREVAQASDVVITMLPNGQVVRDVVFGADGLAEGFKRGAILLDTSSAEPWITRETADKLAKQGVEVVDAPVSGAQEGAASATLVFMVGGSDAAVARCRPLLELMGEHIFHVGPVGSGHTMKTVNNLASALIFVATAEALLIGKAYGLKPSAMIDVLNVSTGVSFATQKRLKQDVVSRKFEDQFKLALMLKDIGIAHKLADERHLPVPMSALGHDIWRHASEAFGPGAVTTEIVRWVEQQMGVELKDD